ncbi:MAG: hypothetical protein IPJ03_19350 [Ignavibacteriales bacterium]|nr:hypothetical protein [Ignavibacteriales bacterium]MBK7381113.1 hypothetical protein [Ignavibacteriales bacterium]
MNTKLTLKLNKRAIEKAKKYAKKNKQSLSGIVENYFNLISNKEFLDEIEISPNVVELSGIINLSDNINIKETYGKHLEEKYS